jgi:hypothetical protein
MLKSFVVAAIALASFRPVLSQETSRLHLAHLLTSDESREGAIHNIAASSLPQLLSLAADPPAQVEKYQLYLGLAEAFGKLRATEAIPFLIRHITLQHWPDSPNTMMKTADVIKSRMPAVAALIETGSPATKALIRSIERMPPQERLCAIFVISQDADTPEARQFLTSIVGQANLELHWAQVGLRGLDSDSTPK